MFGACNANAGHGGSTRCKGNRQELFNRYIFGKRQTFSLHFR